LVRNFLSTNQYNNGIKYNILIIVDLWIVFPILKTKSFNHATHFFWNLEWRHKNAKKYGKVKVIHTNVSLSRSCRNETCFFYIFYHGKFIIKIITWTIKPKQLKLYKHQVGTKKFPINSQMFLIEVFNWFRITLYSCWRILNKMYMAMCADYIVWKKTRSQMLTWIIILNKKWTKLMKW
jgi:hypothetical protein